MVINKTKTIYNKNSMKAINFIKVLRKIIREEVKQVVREELKSVKPLISERHRYTATPIKKVVKPDSIKQEPARRNYPLVTIDGALGDILNETANSMYNNQEQYEEWPDMNGGPVTSEHVGDMDMMNGFSTPQQAYSNMSGDPANMFMKDYSKVLKSAEEKSQSYRS